MKSKLIILSLAGLLAGGTVGLTQDNQPAAGENKPKPESVPANSAPHDPNEVIPLIVMDDVGLNDAIKNLARQAGLNYMLDPKVAFGQIGRQVGAEQVGRLHQHRPGGPRAGGHRG